MTEGVLLSEELMRRLRHLDRKREPLSRDEIREWAGLKVQTLDAGTLRLIAQIVGESC